MKLLFTSLIMGTSLVALAQDNSISRSISDNGKTLSIRVKGTQNGKNYDYDRSFDVSNLDKAARNDLSNRILDSLGLEKLSVPSPPSAPSAPSAPKVSVQSASTQKRNSADGQNPFSKEVSYSSSSGELLLRYKFKRDGKDVLFERTIDARNKSEQERQQLISEVEKEIGVPAKKN
ncbi:hypothetical protein [Tellurirhabdus bombi]|uniref:hypothetical protein n=1 Tax=Tellurirhabdus bombi TaxID=2907205 RepID=UPI001F222A14|nr:hypothetical protein [Tellurirhabdus bombi]